MKYLVAILLAGAVGLTGCRIERVEPEPPQPETQPPRTKEELLAELRPLVETLRKKTNLPPGAAPQRITETEREQVVSGLRDAKIRFGTEEFGQAALRDVAYEIADIAKEAAAQKRWKLVQAAVDAHAIIGIESHYLRRLEDRAKVNLARPLVEVKGFVNDIEKNDIYVFVEITNRKTKNRETIPAREGDEFNDLRLVKVARGNKSVIFEYLPIEGLFFEAKGM